MDHHAKIYPTLALSPFEILGTARLPIAQKAGKSRHAGT